MSTRHKQMIWKGVQSVALLDTTRELDFEGALRSGKTTVCLWKELNAGLQYPGIHGLLARWSDDSVHSILKPVWRQICDFAHVQLSWNAEEQYDELPNGSRFYIRGLKTQDQTSRYSKFRGLTLARAYVDQAEELPQDIYLELAARLSQSGYPHQIVISPNAVEEDHWIAREFPAANNKPQRSYLPISVYDNAHNLSEGVIEALNRLYPPEHPKHRTMVLGQRGMNVIGEPVYKGAFLRAVHEAAVLYDPRLPLEMALDFGKHHPCVVFRQVSPLGQVRFLGGILGQDLFLDDFLDIVLTHRAQWFPRPVEIRECCDPAGSADTSHGTVGAIKTLSVKGLHPVYRPNSNAPDVRLAVIERLAAQMRKRAADRGEAFVVNAAHDRWLRISASATVSERFLAAGFEAGYVWDEHMVSVGSKQVRRPKKDGWYEHGQNCVEYLELNFGLTVIQTEPRIPKGGWPRVPQTWAG